MKRTVIAALLTAALTLPAPNIQAQTDTERILAEFDSLAESVVRIRTIADLEFRARDEETGEIRMATRPYVVEGTGVVVGSMFVNGLLEYLILTNHHVADATNYVLVEGGYLRDNFQNTQKIPSVYEESYLMKAASDSVTENDVGLIEVVRFVQGDMTLMRTINMNRELKVYKGAIGYLPGEVEPGSRIVAGGYPFGQARMVSTGRIVETDHLHMLGIPHEDFVIDIPVEPGQSGGPVFLVEGDLAQGEAITFRLIGLIHAKDRRHTYAVSYGSWEESLADFPDELQERLVR